MTRVTEPMPVHGHDYGNVSNPEPIITVRVQGYFREDGTSELFGRLTHAVDELGNLHPIVGLDPGRVTRCPRCDRKVYVPDAVNADSKVACPYRDCLGWLDKGPQMGDVLVDDAPGRVISGDCYEHHEACHAPKVQTAATS